MWTMWTIWTMWSMLPSERTQTASWRPDTELGHRRHFPCQRSPCGRVRPSLEAIAEEAGYQHTRRRKQLIPRARLIHHHRRSEDPARRSSSLNLQFVSRTRPFLLTPPPDFRSDNFRATGQSRQPVRNESGNTDSLQAECTGGTRALRRTRNSNKNTANEKSNACRNITTAHRPPHTSAFSTPSIIQTGHQTRHPTDNSRFQDSGNETTKPTQLPANADTNRINDSSAASPQTLNRPKEVSVKTPAQSVEASHTSGQYTDDGETANKIQRPRQSASTSTRGVPTDPPVHSLDTFKLCASRQPVNSHREPTARQNTDDDLRTAQDSVGRGPNRTQRPHSERRRKRQYVNETSDKREHKVREIDPADATERLADSRAIQETSGQNTINHRDIEGGQEHCSAEDNRKRALSTGDNIKQVENPANVKNEGIQRVSNGELETTQDISIEKRKTVGLSEYPAGNRAKTEEGSAQQVMDNLATAATDSVTVTLPQDGGTMSSRPQVLKVTDSATTAVRRRDGANHVESIASHAKRSPPASEDGEPKTTQKLRRIFEGGKQMTSSSPRRTAAGIPPAPGSSCEAAKPMLIATLSVEEASDTLQKLSIRKEASPSFRAFSCSGQETLSTITKATQHKEPLHSKVAAFDGLLQYLQDYRHGLRQLLVNSNVVIIEPVRQSTVALNRGTKSAPEGTCRIMGAIVKKGDGTSAASNTLPRQQPILRRHFFYHPIRTNRSLVDEELPDPEKVRHAREMFERTIQMKDSHKEQASSASDTINTTNTTPPKIVSMPKSDKSNADKVDRKYLTVDTVFRHNVLHKRWTDSASLSSGVSSDLSCYEADVESPDTSSRKDAFSSDDDYLDRNCYVDEGDEGHYVAPEILERIRAYGTSVTYYGGQVIAASNGPLRSPMTLAIMDEIEKNQRSVRKETRTVQEECLAVKFRLVKSNSCGSRLELAGTEESDEGQHAPAARKPQYDPKPSGRTENADESKEHKHAAGAKSSETGYEGRSSHGPTDTGEGCIRQAERAQSVERGSNVLFDDIEFEKYEIAEDSLDVIQENATEQASPRDCQPVTDAATEHQPSSTSNVQMTTWASRSVMFDLRNCEGPETEPHHSSC